MRFVTTRLKDVRLVEMHPISDQRGFFSRTFCAREFSEAGLATVYVQQLLSRATAGAIRGMHFQRVPHEEVKLVRCLAGAIHDVLIDLRPSPHFPALGGVRADRRDGRQLYIPPGFAHGFQTLAADRRRLHDDGIPCSRGRQRRPLRRSGIRDPLADPGNGYFGARPGLARF